MHATQTNSTRIKKLPVFDSGKDLEKFLEANFTDSLKQLIRVTVTNVVKAEMAQMREELEVKPHFNGYYDRHLNSTFGRIESIPVPRFRESQSGPPVKSLGLFGAEQERFEALVAQMHLLGISQRKISQLAKTVFGIPLSKDKVGAVYRELAEAEEANLNRQAIDDTYDYLFFDGIWEKTKGYGWDENNSVILCALGVKTTGERKVLGFRLARKEDTEGWQELVSSLKTRGLHGKRLTLVIGDDSAGLKTAVSRHYPTTPFQLCVVHKMRNVLKKTKHKNRPAIAEDLKTIFNGRTKDEATATAKAVAKKWYVAEPAAIESLRHNIEYCFTYLDFPPETASKIRTTNILEREFRELRRRLKGFDSTFQNVESANRYANTLFNYLNANYPLHGFTH